MRACKEMYCASLLPCSHSTCGRFVDMSSFSSTFNTIESINMQSVESSLYTTLSIFKSGGLGGYGTDTLLTHHCSYTDLPYDDLVSHCKC